jgi:hypothetical protein
MGWVFKEFWDKNKDEKNAERRRKYNSDPEYHKRVRKKAKESYNRRIKKMKPTDRQTIVDNSGKKYWSIGRLSRIINRTIIVIRRYHMDGVIPLPTFYDTRGWRLYSTHQVSMMRKAFKQLDEGSMKSLSELTKFLTENWEEPDAKEEGDKETKRGDRRASNR